MSLKKYYHIAKTLAFFGAGTSCAFGLPDIHSLTSETFDLLDLPNKEIFNNAKHAITELTGKSFVFV
jgi:NAD-dependent SIR2 family protein deacetylase